MIDKLRNKKGFTLVELCVVIALMGIVVTMVIVFIGQYREDTYALMKNRNAMGDINKVRQMTNDWIKYYDNGKYTIAPSDPENGSSVLQAKSGNTVVGKLSVTNGKIIWEKNGTQYKVFAFESITKAHISFSKANQNGKQPVIIFRVYYNNSENWQDLLFSVMTQTPRTRYSPAEY